MYNFKIEKKMEKIKLFTLLSVLKLRMVACNIQVFVDDGKEDSNYQSEKMKPNQLKM